MDRLLDIGFEPAGHWLLENDALKFELTRHSTQKNILYAFVCDGQVKYVGKTIRTLAMRMYGYKNPGITQTTNIKNNRRIRESLLIGVAIDIFALPDNGLMHYGQFHLNLAAALEDDLIKKINPEWNGGKTEKTPVMAPATIDHEPNSVQPISATFTFTLQSTYYESGFFNVGVAAQGNFGADGEKIELFLGDDPKPVLGTINRRANANGTPRIMGGTNLRDWFRANAQLLGIIVVEVFSPTSIRLKL
ncbi:GIY-YIG nuclease family protein [Pseudolysobacter antarcticus]|uniref:GIY-YIG nuclease family protein n=1 Tax=Pseudolysobacter antarcticus TaxID=2511995 RepID=UPI001A911D40|nr:GIY-YIG nuclease family protein [Pseudolysobacter antarcticus]